MFTFFECGGIRERCGPYLYKRKKSSVWSEWLPFQNLSGARKAAALRRNTTDVIFGISQTLPAWLIVPSLSLFGCFLRAPSRRRSRRYSTASKQAMDDFYDLNGDLNADLDAMQGCGGRGQRAWEQSERAVLCFVFGCSPFRACACVHDALD